MGFAKTASGASLPGDAAGVLKNNGSGTLSWATVASQVNLTDWVQYTPTWTGFGTVAVQYFEWRRTGSGILLRGQFTSGTSTAVEARISLPAGLTTSSTIVAMDCAGTWEFTNAFGTGGQSSWMGMETSKTYLVFTRALAAISAPLTKQNADAIIGSGNTVSITTWEIPIQGYTTF